MVVEQVETEVYERTRYRLAVDLQVLLGQVPAARPDDQRRDRRIQPVDTTVRVGELNAARHRIAQVELSADHVVPGRRHRVLAIRHEHPCAGIERIDDHLAIGRTGDLDPAVLEIGRRDGDPPVAVADRASFRQEIRQAAAIDLNLPRHAPREQFRYPGPEPAREIGYETQRAARQDLREFRAHLPGHGAAGWQVERGRCAQVRTLVEICRGVGVVCCSAIRE